MNTEVFYNKNKCLYQLCCSIASIFLGSAIAAASFTAESQSELGQAAVVIIGSTFAAADPYIVTVGDTEQTIPLWGIPATFAFEGSTPFVDPETGVADFDAVHVWDPSRETGTYLTNDQIASDGVPGRMFKTDGYTAVGYKSGDGFVQGTLGTQIDTVPISARRRFVWDLNVRFAGPSIDQAWSYTPRGLHPGTVWQLAAPGSLPALSMVVDTDPTDTESLALHFEANTDPSFGPAQLGIATGLKPQQDIQVMIDAFLDDRDANNGGQGYVRIWVNGALVVDVNRPTLAAQETQPHSWSFGMTLNNDSDPLDIDRFGYWKHARMLIPS